MAADLLKGFGIMSMHHVAQAWEAQHIRGDALVALLALADGSDRDGRCEITDEELAKKARISIAKLEAVVAELVAADVVSVFSYPDSQTRSFWLRFPRGTKAGNRGRQ